MATAKLGRHPGGRFVLIDAFRREIANAAGGGPTDCKRHCGYVKPATRMLLLSATSFCRRVAEGEGFPKSAPISGPNRARTSRSGSSAPAFTPAPGASDKAVPKNGGVRARTVSQLFRISPPAAGRSMPEPATRRGSLQTLLYFASTSLIARTFPAERPSWSKVSARKASAMAFATSGPITRAPMVMICALFESAARCAE